MEYCRSIEPQIAGNTLFVDARFGNDETAEPFNGNKPYASIRAALLKVESLSLPAVLEIFIRPGVYSEGKIYLIDNVSIRGSGRLATQVYGVIDTSRVTGSNSTMLEFTLISNEEPAVSGRSLGSVSFRQMRFEANYFTKSDDQSTVVISPAIEMPSHCPQKHSIKEVIVNCNPFIASEDNVRYLLQQETVVQLGTDAGKLVDKRGRANRVAKLKNIEIIQAVPGCSKIQSKAKIKGLDIANFGEMTIVTQKRGKYILKTTRGPVIPLRPSLATPVKDGIVSRTIGHIITDSELVLNTNGGSDIKVVNHLEGDVQLERNSSELNVTSLPQVNVTTIPFTATRDNVEYVLQQATEVTLISESDGFEFIPVLRNIQITQTGTGTSTITSNADFLGKRKITMGETVSIRIGIKSEPRPPIHSYYDSRLVNSSASIPSNLRVYSVGGAERSAGQTFRGLNNRAEINSNSQLFETSNVKVDNVPQPPLPVVQVTTSPFTPTQNNVQYQVTGDTQFILPYLNPVRILPPDPSPPINHFQILQVGGVTTLIPSQDNIIRGPTHIQQGQTVGAFGRSFGGYLIKLLPPTNNISVKQVGESHALNVPQPQVINSNRLINTPGIQGFELQPPQGGGQLVFRIGPPANNTFVALHLFVPQNAVNSIVQTTGNTFFISDSQSPTPPNVFAVNGTRTEGQFKQAGLYGIDDSLSLRTWTVRYLGFPNALTRVSDSAPESPASIAINTPTIETGETVETLVKSEATTSKIHINQVSAFGTRQIPAISHPIEARSLVSVQQVSTEYEHLRGGSHVESTSEQLNIGDRIDNIATLNLQTIILGGSNTLILPDIVPFDTPPQQGQVISGTRYYIVQGKTIVGSSDILGGFFNPIFISGQSTAIQPLQLATTQNVELVATYPANPTTGTNGFWIANLTAVDV